MRNYFVTQIYFENVVDGFPVPKKAFCIVYKRNSAKQINSEFRIPNSELNLTVACNMRRKW